MLAVLIDGDQSGREGLRQQAINHILQNPIFGYGYRLNADLTGFGPHNGLLEVGLCLGIPIVILFTYFIYIRSMIYALKMMIDRRYIFASMMVVSAIISSMSGSSLSTGSFDFAIAFAGIAYYYYFRKETAASKL